MERSVRYIRQSFWPLSQIHNLADANIQARRWFDEVANVRIHGGTGEQPVERFETVRLTRCPRYLPDCRQTTTLLVHKDFAVRFDGNAYTVPPWNVGRRLILKADNQTVSLFHKDKIEATHPRCWDTKQRIEIPTHAEQVKRLRNRLWRDKDIALFASLGNEAAAYLDSLGGCLAAHQEDHRASACPRDEYGAESSCFMRSARPWNTRSIGADYMKTSSSRK